MRWETGAFLLLAIYAWRSKETFFSTYIPPFQEVDMRNNWKCDLSAAWGCFWTLSSVVSSMSSEDSWPSRLVGFLHVVATKADVSLTPLSAFCSLCFCWPPQGPEEATSQCHGPLLEWKGFYGEYTIVSHSQNLVHCRKGRVFCNVQRNDKYLVKPKPNSMVKPRPRQREKITCCT